jgi:hypothetical protein
LAYASGNYDEASLAANQCLNKLVGIPAQGNTLKAQAQSTSAENSVSVYVSLAVAGAVFCGGVAAWVVLSKKERRLIDGSAAV